MQLIVVSDLEIAVDHIAIFDYFSTNCSALKDMGDENGKRTFPLSFAN